MTDYSFTAKVTDSLGGSAQKAFVLTINAAGVGGPQAPTDFYVTLQGQTVPNSSTYRPGNPPASFNVPNATNISLGWPNAVAGGNPIDHYEVQRTADGGATWTSPTGSTSISTAAANAQGTRYTDTTATNCVGSTYGPTAGQYLAATTYSYRLRAVDSVGAASSWVTGAKQYIFNGSSGGASRIGGYKWTTDLSSGYPTNYAVADATYGYVATIDMTVAPPLYGYALLPTGYNYCTYNQYIGDCVNAYFVMKSTNANPQIGMHAEVTGDHPIASIGKVDTYVQGGPIVANQYMTYVVPLSQLLTPTAAFTTTSNPGDPSAVGVQQKTFYKFLWQAANPTIITLALAWFGP